MLLSVLFKWSDTSGTQVVKGDCKMRIRPIKIVCMVAVTGVAEGQGESSESVSVCSDVSTRRESDVEVISNPSISSIEVLADQLIIQGQWFLVVSLGWSLSASISIILWNTRFPSSACFTRV